MEKNAENYFSLKLECPTRFLLGGTLSLAATVILSSNSMVYGTAVTVTFSVKERHFTTRLDQAKALHYTGK